MLLLHKCTVTRQERISPSLSGKRYIHQSFCSRYHNNDAERAIRTCVVIRKTTYGNRSEEGARALARLMSIREAYIKRGQTLIMHLST